MVEQARLEEERKAEAEREMVKGGWYIFIIFINSIIINYVV